MATVTQTLGFFVFDDAGTQTATLQLDYDDALLTPLLVRCINTAPAVLTVTATSTIGNHIGQTASHSFTANQTSVVNLPSGAVNRWSVSITPQGRIDGVEMQIHWGP
jgi:hypothetical protein